jgi:hypothetical protein
MQGRGISLALREALVSLVLITAASWPAEAAFPTGATARNLASRPDTVYATANPPTMLSVHPRLLTRLQVLADALHKEIVLCLHGDVVGDTVRLTRMTMPDPRRSRANSALFGPCPEDALATWHNHPVPPPGLRAPRPVGAGGTAGLCRLSETDIRTAATSGHPFTVVAVDASTLCWWTLQEVHSLVLRESSNTASFHIY